MLKGLLKELGKQWKRHEPGRASLGDECQDRQAAFRKAAPAEREALAQALRETLAHRPEDLPGWTQLGDWLLSLGRLPDAESTYRRALELDPLQARAQEGLGLVLLQLRRLEEAYLHFETAHKRDPGNAEILVHWGLVELALGNLSKAGNKFQRAIERDARNAHAWHNLGLVALKMGDIPGSIDHLTRAIEIKPDHGLAYSNLALALRQADRLNEAVAAARRAVECKRDNARVLVVLGDLLINAADFEEAEQTFRRALEMDANAAAPYVGLGKLYASRGAYAQAKADYEKALALEPGQPDARGGLGQLLLLLQEWPRGWDLYEARRETDAAPVRNLPYPEWQGEPLQDRSVLVHAEQGLGDIILFSSCLPDLLKTPARCHIEVPQRLHKLFERSFSGANVVAHDANDKDLQWLEQLPPIDLHVPLGSLPRQLRRATEAFPHHCGYLRADPQQVEAWRNRLASLPGPRIGLAWRGGLASTAGAQRSLELLELVQALHGCGASLVSLQYGEVGEELARVQQHLGLTVTCGVQGFGDLDEMAALTCALDGIVTVCSTQAHLTGALGVPGLVLVPANPNWRYGAYGTTSPWYPSLTLARQEDMGDWGTPLRAARDWVQARGG